MKKNIGVIAAAILAAAALTACGGSKTAELPQQRAVQRQQRLPQQRAAKQQRKPPETWKI